MERITLLPIFLLDSAAVDILNLQYLIFCCHNSSLIYSSPSRSPVSDTELFVYALSVIDDRQINMSRYVYFLCNSINLQNYYYKLNILF